jgi:hypothetical protein
MTVNLHHEQVMEYLRQRPWVSYDRVCKDAPAGSDTRPALNEILKRGKAELCLSWDYSTQCVVLPEYPPQNPAIPRPAR